MTFGRVTSFQELHWGQWGGWECTNVMGWGGEGGGREERRKKYLKN